MQTFWNEKFQTPHFIYGEAPNAFVKESFSFLEKAKTVICIGEGEGRNALFLADKGLEVEALDASDVGLLKLRKRAKECYVPMKIRHTLVEYWQPTPAYDAAVCTYLHLPKEQQKMLFEKVLHALNPEGIFIAEFFSESQLHFNSGGPKESALLYNFNTTLDTMKRLPCKIIKLAQEVVMLSEGDKHVGRASVIRIIVQKQPQFKV